jgi:hypothetical protein
MGVATPQRRLEMHPGNWSPAGKWILWKAPVLRNAFSKNGKIQDVLWFGLIAPIPRRNFTGTIVILSLSFLRLRLDGGGNFIVVHGSYFGRRCMQLWQKSPNKNEGNWSKCCHRKGCPTYNNPFDMSTPKGAGAFFPNISNTPSRPNDGFSDDFSTELQSRE